MIINEIKKNKTNYQVLIGDKTYILMPETMIKHKIKLGNEISIKELNQLVFDNDYVTYLDQALKALKKSMSVLEMKNLLIKKGANNEIIDLVISHLLKIKLLDDVSYAKKLINYYMFRFGKKGLLELLIKKGINKGLIDECLANHDEEYYLDLIIASKVLQTKGKTKSALLDYLMAYAIRNGFDRDIALSVINKHISNIKINEKELLEKEINKAYLMYENKYRDYDLKNKIVRRLIVKGFSYQKIIDALALILEGKK